MLHRHGSTDFAAGCVGAAWSVSVSAGIRLPLVHRWRRLLVVLCGFLLLKLAERGRPEVDFIFLLAIGGSNVSANEAAEDGQTHKENGPDRL